MHLKKYCVIMFYFYIYILYFYIKVVLKGGGVWDPPPEHFVR